MNLSTPLRATQLRLHSVGVSVSSRGGRKPQPRKQSHWEEAKKIRKVRASMESSAPMNIPAKSWIKDSSTSNSSSFSSPQGMSSLGSSPIQSSLDFNPPCPNCSSTSCTAAFNPSFSPCSSFSRMTELTASTRRKRTSSWSNVWNSMSRNK